MHTCACSQVAWPVDSDFWLRWWEAGLVAGKVGAHGAPLRPPRSGRALSKSRSDPTLLSSDGVLPGTAHLMRPERPGEEKVRVLG